MTGPIDDFVKGKVRELLANATAPAQIETSLRKLQSRVVALDVTGAARTISEWLQAAVLPLVEGEPSMPQSFQTQATAAGLDWPKLIDFISKLDWVQLFAFIQEILAIFRGKKPVMKAVADCPIADHAACCKAHFEAIIALAACGADCCCQE